MRWPSSRPLTCTLFGSLILASLPASADMRPIVLELFTSQACSSCPPADALLRELAGRSDVIALGFHVAYWDGPGWKDPFSSASSTERQRVYARLFNRHQVYTPQLVVDGAREMVGSDRHEVLAALQDARPEPKAPVTLAPDRRSVAIGAGDGHGEVLLARFIKSRATRVAGGENAYRTLNDANAVESLTPLGSWSGSKITFTIAPPQDGEGIAVLVQASDGQILGAGAVR
jgi:hypothetical protein